MSHDSTEGRGPRPHESGFALLALIIDTARLYGDSGDALANVVAQVPNVDAKAVAVLLRSLRSLIRDLEG